MTRPRRSIARVDSYATLLPVIGSSAEESSSESSAPASPRDKGKQRALSDEDIHAHSSGSEYDPSKLKGKKRGRDGDEESHKSTTDEELDIDEDDSIATPDEAESGSDIIPARFRSNSPDEPLHSPPPGQKQKATLAGPRVIQRQTATPKRPPPKPKATVVKSRLAKSTKNIDQPFGLYVEPPSFILSAPHHSALHAPPHASKTGIQQGPPLTEEARSNLHIAMCRTAFGPHWELLEDVGWWKGKWKMEGDNLVRSEKWGGWYDEMQLSPAAYSVIHDEKHLMDIIPKMLDRPSTIYKVGSAEQAGNEEAMDIDPSLTVDNSQGLAAGVLKIKVGVPKLPPPTQELPDPTYLSLTDAFGQTELSLQRFQSIAQDTYAPGKPGWMANAGGPVYGLDWAFVADDSLPTTKDYLAVATLSSYPKIESPEPEDLQSGIIQIWSLDTSVPGEFAREAPAQKGQGLHLELCIAAGRGEAWDVKWCPRGGDKENDVVEGDKIPSIGLLAVATSDGSVSLLSIPQPAAILKAKGMRADDLIFLQPEKPRLALQTGRTPCWCLDWGSHELIAGGTIDGYVAIWKIDEAMANGATSVAPLHYVNVAEGCIRDVAWLRQPAFDINTLEVDYDKNPHVLGIASYDGNMVYYDMDDPYTPILAGHDRYPRNCLTFTPHQEVFQVSEEFGIRHVNIRPRTTGSTIRVSGHNGLVLNLAASDFHPFVASSSADGSVQINNCLRKLRKGRHLQHYNTPIFKLDYARKTGEYRLYDSLKPAEDQGDDTRQPRKPKVVKEEESRKSNAWPPQMQVNRSCWNKSIRRAHLLASGASCGILRVDVTGMGMADAGAEEDKREHILR